MKQFQQRILTNMHLFGGLAVMLLLQTTLLLGLVFGDPLFMRVSTFDSTRDYAHCSSKREDVYTAVIMSFRFFLLLVTAVYTFRIRSIPDGFSK